AAHDLHLSVRRRLVMHAAQRPPVRVERQTALRERRAQSLPGQLLAAPGAGEEAALVAPELEVDHEGAREGRRRELHCATFTSGMKVTKRPPHSRMYPACSMISCFRFQGRITT